MKRKLNKHSQGTGNSRSKQPTVSGHKQTGKITGRTTGRTISSKPTGNPPPKK